MKGGAQEKRPLPGVEKSMLFFGSGGVFRKQTSCELTVSRKGNAEKRDRFSALLVVCVTGTLSVK